MVKTRVWIIVVAALAIASVVAALVLWLVPASTGTVAKVYVDGECVYTVNLDSVGEPYRYSIHTAYGDNLLEIEHSRVRIVDADCAGNDCVRQGWISTAGKPLVCIPHHLVVRIERGKQDNEVVL